MGPSPEWCFQCYPPQPTGGYRVQRGFTVSCCQCGACVSQCCSVWLCACVGSAVRVCQRLCVLPCVTDQRVIKLLTRGLVIFPQRGPIISAYLIAYVYVSLLMSAYTCSGHTVFGFPFICAGSKGFSYSHALALQCLYLPYTHSTHSLWVSLFFLHA